MSQPRYKISGFAFICSDTNALNKVFLINLTTCQLFYNCFFIKYNVFSEYFSEYVALIAFQNVLAIEVLELKVYAVCVVTIYDKFSGFLK